MLIAGGGKRMLTFAAQFADIIGVNTNLPTAKHEPPRHAMAFRRALTRSSVGFEKPPETGPPKSSCTRGCPTPRSPTIPIELPSLNVSNRFGAAEEEVRSSPKVLIGEVGEIVERIHALRERWGYSYFTIQQPAALEFVHVIDDSIAEKNEIPR